MWNFAVFFKLLISRKMEELVVDVWFDVNCSFLMSFFMCLYGFVMYEMVNHMHMHLCYAHEMMQLIMKYKTKIQLIP